MVKQPIYPIEPWSISETAFSVENSYRNETVFSLSNGYLGTRGTFEEGYDFDPSQGLEGNFINGFYESESIRYGECCFGFPATSQTLLNLPNAKGITLRLPNGEAFDLRTGCCTDYRRTLHLDKGLLSRTVDWVSPKGLQLHLETERLVSFFDKHLMLLRYQVTPLNFSGTLTLTCELNGDVCNHTHTTNPLIDYGPYDRSLLVEQLTASKEGLFLLGRTRHSGLSMACMATAAIDYPIAAVYRAEELLACAEYTAEATPGVPVCLTKYIAYVASTDTPEQKFLPTLQSSLQAAQGLGFDSLVALQRQTMDQFWRRADIVIDGNDALQQGLRFNLFHIMQPAGRDGYTGMGAKGLSGEGYEGHYFWDTEMYLLPVFTHTCPELSRALLDYRYHTLPDARKRARELGHPSGALYPWRTINGQEASAYYPLGTAQYHINADVAYAFWQYVTVTGDLNYLADKAAEVLCETARVWADVGCFAESRGGQYCICCVTGPDEYNALVDNNCYTNLMARENLRSALSALSLLQRERPAAYAHLVETIGLQPEETVLWQRIIDRMYLPYDKELGVYLQDDGYLQRKPWDEDKIPPEKRHLLFENYHPLFVFRHRMSKQADTILGLYLYDYFFDTDELRRNFNFYQQTTLHHSSLSTCIFGLLACRIGEVSLAANYFAQSARMDLDDTQQNVYAGIHAANMAGSWLTIANGFGGLRTNNGRCSFAPQLPPGWAGYRFRVCWRSSVVECSVTSAGVDYTLLEGSSIKLYHHEQPIILQQEEVRHHEAL